jgi:hypothetical protein
MTSFRKPLVSSRLPGAFLLAISIVCMPCNLTLLTIDALNLLKLQLLVHSGLLLPERVFCDSVPRNLITIRLP